MNAANIWAFADVDDMLISTVRECPVNGSQPVAVDDKGSVCGWLTPKQSRFLELFRGTVNMVLTTARTSKGVSQLSLPITGYAIVSFGGVIRMPDGSVEPRFHALMCEQTGRAKPVLDDLLARVQSACQERNIDARARIASDAGLDLFLSVKHNKRNVAELQVLRDALEPHVPWGWRVHFNGNFLAVMPAFLGKEIAVKWFMENVAGADALAIGMGDSLTDLPFMGLCDFAVMPTRSQSFSSLVDSGAGAGQASPARLSSIH